MRFFTLVRISNTDPTRPITEMQSGNASITNHSGECYRNTHDNRRTANASTLRQGTHALGVDGKLLTELLGEQVRINM